MSFVVVFADGTTRRIVDADSYEQEGPLTTFFSTDGRPARLASAFSTRVASVRTDRVVEIHRVGAGTLEAADAPRAAHLAVAP